MKALRLSVLVLLLGGLLSAPALAQGAAGLAQERARAEARWRAAVAAGGENSPDALIAEWDYAIALTNAGELAAAEPRWRRMIAVAEPLGEGSSLLAQIRLQLAANLVRQGKAYDEVRALALAGLPVMIAEVGESHEIVGLGRMALAVAYVMQGRYAEAEPPARAAYDAAMARGDGQGVAPLAMLLQQIYLALDRDADARAVMLGAETADSAWSSRRHRLTVLREAENWPVLAAAARDYARDWRAEDDPLSLSMAQEAEMDLIRALTELAILGQDADFAEADRLSLRLLEERRDSGGWDRARALTTRADLLLLWPGREDVVQATALKGEALAALEADIGPDHPVALNQRLGYGALLMLHDPAAAAPVLTVFYAAAQRGLVAPSDWAMAAGLLADALSQSGRDQAAYALVAEAAASLRGYALAPERRTDGRGLIARHDRLFRAQVALAWTLAGPPAATAAPVR